MHESWCIISNVSDKYGVISIFKCINMSNEITTENKYRFFLLNAKFTCK